MHGDKPLVYLDNAATSQKPQQVHRHHRRVLLAAQRQRAPRHPRAGRGGHGAVRGRPRQGGGVHQRPARGGRLHQELLRGAEPGRQRAGLGRRARTASARATRSSSRRWSTTPTSCRGSCTAERTGATLRWFGITDEGRLDLSNLDELINERTKVVSLVHVSNILGTRQPGRDHRQARARGRRAGGPGRLAVRPAPAAGRAARSAPTSSPSPGTRCSARPASACCGAAGTCWRSCRRSSAAAR